MIENHGVNMIKASHLIISVKRLIQETKVVKEAMPKKGANINDLLPPNKLIDSIGGGFREIGNEFLQYFIEIGGLKPNEKVLDVGCGVGRMAVPLIDYLNEDGRYEGFDIMPKCIDWCKKNISSNYPRFQFQLVNIYNKNYNPNGTINALEYMFPYEDNTFDFVFLTSVFTHMLPAGVDKYLSEIARVLKNEGRCLITYFILNEEALGLIQSKRSSLDFRYSLTDHCRTTDGITPEAAIAYDESFIRMLYHKYNFRLAEPVYYGGWCGRAKGLSYQDIIIAEKM